MYQEILIEFLHVHKERVFFVLALSGSLLVCAVLAYMLGRRSGALTLNQSLMMHGNAENSRPGLLDEFGHTVH